MVMDFEDKMMKARMWAFDLLWTKTDYHGGPATPEEVMAEAERLARWVVTGEVVGEGKVDG